MNNYTPSVPVNKLVELTCGKLSNGRFPVDTKWTRGSVKELGIPTHAANTKGGAALAVRFSDLPPDTQIACLQRVHGVAADDGPDAALWSAFVAKSAGVREAAERALAILASFEKRLESGRTTKEATEATCAETGLSRPTIKRMRAKVGDVSRADWLPTPAANYKGGGNKAEMSEDAWTYFLSILEKSDKRFPLSSAHRDTTNAAKLFDWA